MNLQYQTTINRKCSNGDIIRYDYCEELDESDPDSVLRYETWCDEQQLSILPERPTAWIKREDRRGL